MLVNLLENELEVLFKTDHPHIVKVTELLQDDANIFIVSELMSGGELYGHIIKEKKLSERQAASVIKQVLLAINYMHKQKIVHRDLKPENILISGGKDGSDEAITVKLTDFGFACYFTDQGMSTILGSPLYMAPEIVKEETYDEKVDIWSIGVITHILITGCPPFFGKSKMEIYKKIVGTTPTFGKFRAHLSE